MTQPQNDQTHTPFSEPALLDLTVQALQGAGLRPTSEDAPSEAVLDRFRALHDAANAPTVQAPSLEASANTHRWRLGGVLAGLAVAASVLLALSVAWNRGPIDPDTLPTRDVADLTDAPMVRRARLATSTDEGVRIDLVTTRSGFASLYVQTAEGWSVAAANLPVVADEPTEVRPQGQPSVASSQADAIVLIVTPRRFEAVPGDPSEWVQALGDGFDGDVVRLK